MTASNRRVGWGSSLWGWGDLETRSCAVDSDLLLLLMNKLKLAYCYDTYYTLNLKPDISPHLQTCALTKQNWPVRACVEERGRGGRGIRGGVREMRVLIHGW